MESDIASHGWKMVLTAGTLSPLKWGLPRLDGENEGPEHQIQSFHLNQIRGMIVDMMIKASANP